MNEFIKHTMSATDRPNLRRWAGVGWGTKEAEKLLCKRFWVGGENRI